MFTVFRHTLTRSRGAILGWGLSLGLLGMVFAPFYGSMAENMAQFEELLSMYPKEFLGFFSNSGNFSFATPEGFIAVEFFSYMPLILGVFAIMIGGGMLAADEERGVLDLVAAHPVSRTSLFVGRFLAFLASLLLILGIAYVGLVVSTSFSAMELDAIQLLVPFASLFAVLFFFFGLALLLSMLLPSRGMAGMVAGIVLVASFFLNGLANINDSLSSVEPFLPTRYYQFEGWAEGLQWTWFLGLIAVGLAFVALAWWSFQGRDIRVGGEGSWRLPFLRRKAAAR